ncbi:MAG: hypothetical protein J6Y62_07205 [Clostridia bacterium]|nr:hypothetical protein [Clostridia bacterium]
MKRLEWFRWVCRAAGLAMGLYVLLAVLPALILFLVFAGLCKMAGGGEASSIMEKEVVEYYRHMARFLVK